MTITDNDGLPPDIPLHALVLALRGDVNLPLPAKLFLRNFADARGLAPDGFGLADFLGEVWPDGMPATLFAANIGTDADAPAHRIDLLLRPTCEGPRAADFATGGLTIGCHAYRERGRLVIRRVEVTPHVALRDFEARVIAPIRWDDHGDAREYMSGGDLDALAVLPFQRAKTRQRLDKWRRYLAWKEKLIRDNQIRVRYDAWRIEGEQLFFLVHRDDVPPKLVGTELGAIPPAAEPEEDEQPANDSDRRGRRPREPEVMVLGDVEAVQDVDPRRDRERWEGTDLRSTDACVVIRVDEDRAELLRRKGPPAEGQLVSSIAGDLAPLRNQQAGVDRLNNNQGFSPRLADFIFDARGASVPTTVLELDPVPGGRELNEGQREAVAKALAAPDLCLIQGPPGTGKTTVIADICLRAARDGKRVLVASQTNLAVDNALARLADNPSVRPLRLGDPDRVDDEFRDFLADNVVARWFTTIADHCRKRVEEVEGQASAVSARERRLAGLREALAELEAGEQQLATRGDVLRVARGDAAQKANAASEAETALDAHRRRMERLDGLMRWAGGAPLLPDAAAEPLPHGTALPPMLNMVGSPLLTLDLERSRRTAIRDLLGLLEAADAGGASDPPTAARLRALREEKAALVDSVEDADMQQLRAINREIKVLATNGWNRVTGALERAAKRAWPESMPVAVHEIIDALEPSQATTDAVARARELVVAALARCDVADTCAREAADHWRTQQEQASTELAAFEDAAAKARNASAGATSSLDAAAAAAATAEDTVSGLRTRWQRLVDATGMVVRPGSPRRDVIDAAARSLADAQAAAAGPMQRAARWGAIQAEWLERLRDVSESDRDHLQALYVRHSNVVGMTCNEAGKRKTWLDAEFVPFDLVIVDEVSKATPPELILPLLLGEKAILVGDHRQLPPMFRERDASYGDAAEEGQISRADFEAFRSMVTSSLFEELFARAPEELRAMLWTQYRMHPQVMDAVNEFYEGRLEAGPDRDSLARQRGHHLDIRTPDGSRWLTPDQHLLWIDSSQGPDGKPVAEEQRGSSKANMVEVSLTIEALKQLGRALQTQGYGETRKISVSGDVGAMAWAELLRAKLPRVPMETMNDLFQERRIRVDGRALRPDERARPGVIVDVQAQKEVGLITFYGAQLGELRRAIDRARAAAPTVFTSMELRTNTVDRFQGMEKPIVLVSLVRATRGRLGDFVREYQRINVALSRAQQLLVVIGAEETWRRAQVPLPPLAGGEALPTAVYQHILETARRVGGRRLARQLLAR